MLLGARRCAAGQASSRQRPAPCCAPPSPEQVPHIGLTFVPGSDAAVKQWLAFRLSELRADGATLSSELERAQVRKGRGGGSWALALWRLACTSITRIFSMLGL